MNYRIQIRRLNAADRVVWFTVAQFHMQEDAEIYWETPYLSSGINARLQKRNDTHKKYITYREHNAK